MLADKKIMLVRNANSFDFGGGERYSINLATELKKLGYSPMIATAHEKIFLTSAEKNLDVKKMPWLKNQNFSGFRIVLIGLYIIWQLKLFFWYLNIIKKKSVDVLHLQSRDDFIAGTLAGKLLRKKVIWTDHADLKYLFLNVKHPTKNPIGKMVYISSKIADKIIIVSKNEEKLIQSALGNLQLRNSTIIYNGVIDLKIKKIRKSKLDTPVFSLTSRLVDSKGLREVILASKKLDETGTGHKVLLLGEGPQEREYRDIAGRSIVFMGYPRNALSYVAGSDFFLHPTYNEAFSISLVEAAMLGMPVITTRVGGNPEIITDKETGILIEPCDIEALAKSMLYAINHRTEMKKYGNNLRKKYVSEFNFDEILRNKILTIYN